MAKVTMAERFAAAMHAARSTDLVEMSKILTVAVQEVIQENGVPYYDPAVQFIAFRIAFAANGDNTLLPRYDAVYKFIQQRAMEGPNGYLIKEEDRVEIPILKAS